MHIENLNWGHKMSIDKEQIDWVSSESEKNNHGGKRDGSGRKTKYASTKVIRVASDYEAVIKALIAHLDSTSHIDKNYHAEESECTYLRSIAGKAQMISFKTTPIKKT